MRREMQAAFIFLFLILTMFVSPADAVAGSRETDRIAYYQTCGEPDPGLRLKQTVFFLEERPDCVWSDRVRTVLFGVVASGGWREGSVRPGAGFIAQAVKREGVLYLKTGSDDPDRVLLLSEAYIRSGADRDEALSLALKGGALARTAKRPESTPLNSWGRMKSERIARSDYLVGLAYAAVDDPSSAVASFRKALDVFRSDPRFREEYTEALHSIGRTTAEPEDLMDEKTAVMDAIGEQNLSDRIRKYEEYLVAYPDGRQAVEIGIRLVEAYTQTPDRKRDGVDLAKRLGSRTEDPEVLTALAFTLAEAGAGTGEAVRFAGQAKSSFQTWIRDPATAAADLPGLQSALLMIRDSYGWALLKDGKIDRAVQELREASESGYPEVSYHYGVALFEAGRAFDAIEPLLSAHEGGIEEAGKYLHKIRTSESALRNEVDDRLARSDEFLRRRVLNDNIPRPAPDFFLVSTEGKVVSLSGFHGEVVVLAFWTTWCDPCRDQLPHLQEAMGAFAGKPVRFIGINTDRDFWQVKPMLESSGIGMTTLLTAGETGWEETARDFRLNALPALFIIDRNGMIRWAEEEYDGNGRVLKKTIGWRVEKLLAE